MPLNKQQLVQENNTNFPNNNAQLITPELLRQFNNDMIDAMQLTQSMSEYAVLNGANSFVGNQTITGNLNVTGVISASVLYVQTETASVIYSSGSNQFGDELTDMQTLSGSVKVQGSLTVNGVPVLTGSVSVDTGSLVTTASFNAYTQSTNLRLNSLETNSASVNVSISNLNTTTASLSTSITNINSFTQSQAALNGTFATTGSNTFTGNQIIDRASKLYTNGIYWTDMTAGFNNLEIINQGGGNLDFASLNGGRMRVVNTPLQLTGSILSSNSDISTSANIYAANLTGSGVLPTGTISSSAQITALGFVSSSVTASSLITASLSGQTLTFTKGDSSTFGIVLPDVSGSGPTDISSLNAFTASQLTINTGYNTFTQSAQAEIDSLQAATASYVTTSSFNSYTSSTNSRLTNIELTTASLNSSITQLNASSASQQVSINNLNTTTASLLIETQNLELFSASALSSISQLNASSASQQISINNLNTTTASLNTSVSNLNTFSASALSSISQLNASSASQQISINSLNAATASYVTETESGSFLITASFSGNTLTFTKGNNTTFGVVIPDVSGSTINTGSFATTGSNAFFGTNSFSGAVSFSGSAPTILSSSFSGSLITNLTDIYTDIPAVQQIVTLTSASYAALLSGSLTNPNTLYIVSGSTSGSATTDITALNEFTASQLTINSGYNSFTQSAQSQLTALTNATASYAISSSVAAVDAGQQSQIDALIAATGSYSTSSTDITSLNAFTASQETKDLTLASVTSSLNSATASLFTSASLALVTASFDNGTRNLTFTKGDTQTFSVNIPDASGSAGTTIYEVVYTGENITKGDPLYISGSQGANPVVYKADASNPAKMPVTFISNETIGVSNTTEVIVLGLIEGIDLTGYTAGQTIYVAEGGGYSTSLPSGSNSITQLLGVVTKAGSGGKGLVLNPGPALLPGLDTGKMWVGNGNNQPTEITTASFVSSASFNSYTAATDNELNNLISQTGSYATTGANTFNGSQIISGNLDVTDAGYIYANVVNANVIIQTPNIEAGSSNELVLIGDVMTQKGVAIRNGLSVTGSLRVTQTLTASLQEGYVWAGGAGNISTLVATSSFAGATINTGSFATTGSNTFTGQQTIKDSLVIEDPTNQLIYTQLAQNNVNGLFQFYQAGGNGYQFNNKVQINGELTASLQEGYVWAGGAGNTSKLVATSSFGGGSTIDTGSFAITGSNTFYGSQTISGSVLPLSNFGGSLGASGQNWTNLYVNEIQGLSNLRVDTIKFNGVTLPLASIQPRQFFGNGIDASTAMYYGTSSSDVNALRELTYVPSGSPTTPDMNILSASFASTIGSIVTGTGFATTGSNTFTGNQTISTAGNTQLNLIAQPGFQTNVEFQSQNSNLQAYGDLNINNNGQYGGSGSIKVLVKDNKMIMAASQGFQMGVTNAVGNGIEGGAITINVPSGSNELQLTGSLNVSNSLTASLAQGYVWVGDNNSRTTLVATSSFGGGGGTAYANPTLNPYSGSLILVANTFTSSSFAHISASANGQVNLVFKSNNNTADTIISGSNNIFTNPNPPTAGFKRYIGNANIFLGVQSPQISASMQFSPLMNGNVGGIITLRGPVSASTMQVTQNILANGQINFGSTATLHAQGLIGQSAISQNFVAGQLNVIANQSNITNLTNVTQNNINGAVTLNLSSSAAIFSQNTVNDSNFSFTNQFSSGAVGTGQVTIASNTFSGGGNTLIITGSQPTLAPAQANISNNILVGNLNTIFINSAESRFSGTNIYHHAASTGLIGNRLIVTGSSNINGDINSHGSTFVGRFNAVDGIRDRTSDIIFAVGTGTSGTRKTGFHIDSGSNTFVEGTFNVSGSSAFNGNVNITGSLLVNGATISTVGFATTGSNSFNGNQRITGSLTMSGSIITVDRSGNDTNLYLGLNALGMGFAGAQPLAEGNTIAIAIGQGAMRFASGSSQNVAIGNNALLITTGSKNFAMGSEALSGNTTGQSNIAIGTSALQNNTTGESNTAIGDSAAQFASGSFNTFIGVSSGYNVTGSFNTILGKYQGVSGEVINNNIVLADGQGNLKAQYSGSAWSFQDNIKFNKGTNKTTDIVSVNGSVTVNNSLVTPASIILVTTQNSTTGPVYPAVVTSKGTGTFDIAHNYGGNLDVAYLIINPT